MTQSSWADCKFLSISVAKKIIFYLIVRAFQMLLFTDRTATEQNSVWKCEIFILLA